MPGVDTSERLAVEEAELIELEMRGDKPGHKFRGNQWSGKGGGGGGGTDKLAVKPQAWRKELGDIRQYLAEFGSRTPGTLYSELEEVEERLG